MKQKSFFGKYALALAGAFFFAVSVTHAQTQTNVQATVVDPLGIPYANGTYSVQLVPSGTNPTVNGRSIGGAFNGATDATGSFNVALWPNASILPAGTHWQFTVCVSPGVQPPLGTGPQCSTPPAVVTIAGTPQNLSATLNAVAPRLTSIGVGGGIIGGTVTPTHLIFASGANIAGDVAGSAVTAGTGAINLTAGADTTIPLSINAHSGTQSNPLLNVFQTTTQALRGTVNFFGVGLGSFPFGENVTSPVEVFISSPNVGISTAGGVQFGIGADGDSSDFYYENVFSDTTSNNHGTQIVAITDGGMNFDTIEFVQNTTSGLRTLFIDQSNAAGNELTGVDQSVTGTAGDVAVFANGAVTANLDLNGTSGVITANATTMSATGLLTTAKYSSTTNCASAASPAVCGSAPAGAVVVAAGATTVVVNSSAVNANSDIFVQFDASLGTRLGVTCNTTVALPSIPTGGRTAGVSFTITVPAAPAVNPACYSYWIVN